MDTKRYIGSRNVRQGERSDDQKAGNSDGAGDRKTTEGLLKDQEHWLCAHQVAEHDAEVQASKDGQPNPMH